MEEKKYEIVLTDYELRIVHWALHEVLLLENYDEEQIADLIVKLPRPLVDDLDEMFRVGAASRAVGN